MSNLLNNIEDSYYENVGKGVRGLQTLRARIDYPFDREVAYVSDMKRNPFSLRNRKYMGDSISVVAPPLASKPGKNTQETINNFITEATQPRENKVLSRLHTHPQKLMDTDISHLRKPPSSMDFLAKAGSYAMPQNKGLRYNSDRIFTKENGKNVIYDFDIGERHKENIRKAAAKGDIALNNELINSQNAEGLRDLRDVAIADVGARIDDIRGIGSTHLENKFRRYTDLMDKRNKALGRTVVRREI